VPLEKSRRQSLPQKAEFDEPVTCRTEEFPDWRHLLWSSDMRSVVLVREQLPRPFADNSSMVTPTSLTAGRRLPQR
jgi:hypothetical protein